MGFIEMLVALTLTALAAIAYALHDVEKDNPGNPKAERSKFLGLF